jgi:hypothetical protein
MISLRKDQTVMKRTAFNNNKSNKLKEGNLMKMVNM